MRWATTYDGPVYLRMARDPGRDIYTIDDDRLTLRPTVLRGGERIALVSTGAQSARALGAAERLADDGLDVAVVHVPCLENGALIEAIGDVEIVVTVEEHSVIGGLGGLVAEAMAEAGMPARLRRLGLPDIWGESAPNDFLLDKYGLSEERIQEFVAGQVERSTPAAS